jgi:hypothetical protein
MKECSKCGLEKANTEFGVCAAREDGLQSYCIVCMRKYRELRTKKKPEGWVRKTADLTEYHRDYRKSHPEAMREKARRKYERQMKALHGPGYVVGDPGNRIGKHGQTMKFVGFLTDEDRKRQRRAGRLVNRALARGTLVKTCCEVCGVVEVEAHHTDYDAPLSVVWLCRKHHQECHPLTHVRVDKKPIDTATK